MKESNTDPIRPGLTLLQATVETFKLRQISLSTEKNYLFWIRFFIKFHKKKHPRLMGEPEIEQFLSYLSISQNVAPSTQSQALNSIVFLYKHA